MTNPFGKVVLAPDCKPAGEQFGAFYSAADFAQAEGFYFETLVTITWGQLGVVDAQVQDAFTAFQKRMRDWMVRRGWRPVWIYAHERGGQVGLHTHLAVALPSDPGFPAAFRAWLRASFGELNPAAPKSAVHVQGRYDDPAFTHWLHFNYLAKSMDRTGLLVSGRGTQDGRALHVDDVLVFRRPPSPSTGLRRSFGWSHALGPAQRAKGLIRLEPSRRPRSSDEPKDWLLPDMADRKPFRSSFEDGKRDLDGLYPQAFLRKLKGYDPGSRPAAIDRLDI